jgi:cobalt-zinc-cadmium efflux system protein
VRDGASVRCHASSVHSGHDHAHDAGATMRPLMVALILTAAYAAVEVVGGLVGGSLALLADAGHMASDAAALVLALVAARLAARPAGGRYSYGLRRAEVLAALANGLALVAVAVWVIVEAAVRMADPPEVAGGTTLLVATVGLGVNAAAAGVLWRGRWASLNVRAALLHVGADALGSLGVILAAGLIIATGWLLADPLAGLLIGLLILAGAWGVLRDSVSVLLEAVPRGVDPEEVGRVMAAVPGVVDVHDLHLWAITPGFPALSAHVVVEPAADCHAIRRSLDALLASEHGIEHVTLQVEHAPAPRLVPPPTPAGVSSSRSGP